MPRRADRRGRPVKMPSPWKELAERVGSSKALAEKLGISTSTLNRWANLESSPSYASRKEIRRLCSYYSISLPEDWIK